MTIFITITTIMTLHLCPEEIKGCYYFPAIIINQI